MGGPERSSHLLRATPPSAWHETPTAEWGPGAPACTSLHGAASPRRMPHCDTGRGQSSLQQPGRTAGLRRLKDRLVHAFAGLRLRAPLWDDLTLAGGDRFMRCL